MQHRSGSSTSANNAAMRDACECMGDPDGPAPGGCGSLFSAVQFWALVVCVLVVACVLSVGLYSCSQSETCDISKYLVWVWVACVLLLMGMVCIMGCSGTWMRRMCKRCVCCKCVESGLASSSSTAVRLDEDSSNFQQSAAPEGGIYPSDVAIVAKGPNGHPIIDVRTAAPLQLTPGAGGAMTVFTVE